MEAVVSDDGLPVESRAVARFTVPRPAPPAPPASATATERTGTLTLRWARADRATSYLVSLRAGRLRLDLSTTRTRLAVRGLTWRPTSVRVRAVERFARSSAARTAAVHRRP